MQEQIKKDQIKSLQDQLQTGQDLLNATMAQRNSALNDVVKLSAQMEAMARKMAELETKLKLLEPKDSDEAARRTNGALPVEAHA